MANMIMALREMKVQDRYNVRASRNSPGGEIGRHARLKISSLSSGAGSSPAPGTRIFTMTSDSRAILFGLVAVLCWSTVATAFKVSLQLISTQQLMFHATLTATLVLLGVAWYRTGLRSLLATLRREWRITLAAGLLNPVIYYEVLFRAYDRLPAQIAMSVNYTWAIVLSLMVAIFLRHKMRPVDFIAAAICYAGVVLVVTGGRLTSLGDVSLMGLLLALSSTVIWAGYWIINMRDRRDPVTGLCLNFLVALPLVALNCWWFSSLRVDMQGFLAASYVGLMEMALGFLFWSIALRASTNAARISNLVFLAPFLSLVFIYLFLGEAIQLATLGGLVMIIGGISWQQWSHSYRGME